MTKKDIEKRQDVDLLIYLFYEKAIKDKEIGHFFTNVVELDLKTHLPVIGDFWESILLKNSFYKGNPMLKHLELTKKSPIAPKHFERWLKIWEETVNHLFNGPVAQEAIEKANQIAQLMQLKIKHNKSKGSL